MSPWMKFLCWCVYVRVDGNPNFQVNPFTLMFRMRENYWYFWQYDRDPNRLYATVHHDDEMG